MVSVAMAGTKLWVAQYRQANVRSRSLLLALPLRATSTIYIGHAAGLIQLNCSRWCSLVTVTEHWT
jgi:hypothetical protein